MKSSTVTTSAERIVGKHVFHQIPKLNPAGSIIFFFTMISFGCAKNELGKIRHFGKIVQFVRALEMAKHDFTQFGNVLLV